jgi:phosphatidylinositol 4-phosphatase
LVKSKSTEWVVGFISGYINNIKYEQVSSKAVEFLIVSRRDKRRQGMRFVSRGCNLDGHCTNSVETEQLLHLVQDKTYYSYVQTRGSIPFKWTQKPDMKWSP